MDVSVVICCFTEKRWGELTAAVASVQGQSLPARELVLVVDHSDSLLERAGRELDGVRIVENRNAAGLSGARNSGIEAAQGDVVAFLDDDAAAAPDWLETLAHGYERGEDVLAVGGAVEPDWVDRRPAWFPPEFDWVVGCSHSGMPRVAERVRNLIGANMSFRRELLVELGGFRSELGRVAAVPVGCEETELCIRATQRRPGGTILYDPAARVRHRVPRERATVRYFLSRCNAEGRSKALVAKLVGRQDGLAAEREYTRRTLPAGVARGIGDAVRGRPSGLGRAGAILAGLGMTAFGYARAGRGPDPARADDALRVALVTPRYPPEVGGVERHVAEVSRRFARAGARVTVLCTDRSGSLPARELSEGVEVRRVRAWPRRSDYYLAPGIWRELRRGDWDLVHVQSYHTFVAPLAMLAALGRRIPYVVTFHGGGHSSTVRSRLRPLQRRLLRPLLARAARLVAVARFEVDLYARELSLPRERFVLIPNGVDPPPPAAGTNGDGEGGLIASVGRLERYKGHDRLVAALPHVLSERPDARLWIAGTGPHEDALRRQAQELGVADRVEIAAAPDRDALASRLSGVGLVALLSDFETQPLAALEAAALGRPLLVADGSGMRELAEDGLARAIPPDSPPAEVARAIVEQLGRPPAANPTLPSWDDCAAALLALYGEVAR